MIRKLSEVEPKLEMTRLGSYNIVRKLARGGMAELYLARSVGPEGFEKLVVLKKILPKYAENQRFVQLFLDEAKLAASLDHPNVVQVYDMGRVEGNYFFTMEYVHGQDVRSLLRHASRQKRHVPIAIAVQIARSIASALHHAHERRRPDGTLRDVVHRDVSPSNILVSYDGAVKLADFGVAKASSSSVRTRTGALKGKVGYMSPEQARGASIDRRSDIFSLGVVLWELVSMRRLFKSDNDLATIQSIIHEPPQSLLSLRADCPPGVDRIARTALEKDPATRYQTAQLLQRDLDELARELRLDQSSIALSSFMNEVFEAEITAWKVAQSSGSTVTDFVISGGSGAPSAPDLMTPASESDFSLEDPGDEESDSGPEMDDEVSEPTALPPQQPRAGTIQNDDEATAIGQPPMIEAAPESKVVVPKSGPVALTFPKPKDDPPPKRATPAPTKQPPMVLPSAPPAPKPVPISKAITPPDRPARDEENPFDNAATRLRPNPLTGGDNQFDAAPTSVASSAFTEEAPTVQAMPEVVKSMFDVVETVVSAPSFRDEAITTPSKQVSDPALEPTALGGPVTLPIPKDSPDEVAKEPTTNPYGAPPPQAKPPVPYHYPGLAATQTPSVYIAPQTPASGVPSMPPHVMPPHMQALPMKNPGLAQMQSYDPNLDIGLAPQRRWLVIAGVAVGVAVLAIVLIVVLSRGSDDEPTESPEPAPKVEAPDEPTKPPAKPAIKNTEPAGSGSADAGSGSAAPTSPRDGWRPPIRKQQAVPGRRGR